MGREGHVGGMGERGSISVGKPQGKRKLGRPRRSWEDNIRMYLKEIEWECVDWMHLAQDWDQWRLL
jgi:hypothetical protein